MESQRARDQLDSRFRKMKEEGGLLDMKFFFGQVSETTVDGFCEEVNRLYKLVDEGRFVEIKRWDDAKGLPDHE